jgi:hypothetical protein
MTTNALKYKSNILFKIYEHTIIITITIGNNKNLDNGSIVAFKNNNILDIADFGVNQPYRNKGYGTMLLHLFTFQTPIMYNKII